MGNEKEKLFCKYCDYTAKNKYNFKRHLKTTKHQKHVDGNTDYCCEACDYTTHDKSNFNKHLKTKGHLQMTGQVKADKKKKKETYCHICDRDYASHNSWRVHQYIHTNKRHLNHCIRVKVTLDGRRKRYQRLYPTCDKEWKKKIKKKEKRLREAKYDFRQMEDKTMKSEQKIRIRQLSNELSQLQDVKGRQDLAQSILQLEKKFAVLKELYENPSKEMKKQRKAVAEHTISAKDIEQLKEERKQLKAQLEDIDDDFDNYEDVFARLNEVNDIILNHMD